MQRLIDVRVLVAACVRLRVPCTLATIKCVMLQTSAVRLCLCQQLGEFDYNKLMTGGTAAVSFCKFSANRQDEEWKISGTNSISIIFAAHKRTPVVLDKNVQFQFANEKSTKEEWRLQSVNMCNRQTSTISVYFSLLNLFGHQNYSISRWHSCHLVRTKTNGKEIRRKRKTHTSNCCWPSGPNPYQIEQTQSDRIDDNNLSLSLMRLTRLQSSQLDNVAMSIATMCALVAVGCSGWFSHFMMSKPIDVKILTTRTDRPHREVCDCGQLSSNQNTFVQPSAIECAVVRHPLSLSLSFSVLFLIISHTALRLNGNRIERCV